MRVAAPTNGRHPGRQRQGRDHFRVGDDEPYREHEVQQENGRARGTQPRTGKPLTGCPQQQRRDAPLNEDNGSGNKEVERINHAGNPVLLSHYRHPGIHQDGDGRRRRGLRAQHLRGEGYRLPARRRGPLPFGVRPAAFRSDQQRRGCVRRADLPAASATGAGPRLLPGNSGTPRLLPRLSSKRTAGRISGACSRRDCWLLSLATRSHRSARLREASKRPLSDRAASTGTMRSTPSSVAFSTIHSKRSNLISAAHSVTRRGGAFDSTGSSTRNTTRAGCASTISAR